MSWSAGVASKNGRAKTSTIVDKKRPSRVVKKGESTAASAYARTALEREAAAVAAAEPGTRNDTLNKAAYSLGGLVANGHLNEREVEEVLMDAACWENSRCTDGDAQKIAAGIAAGKAEPRDVPEPRQLSESDSSSEAPPDPHADAPDVPPDAPANDRAPRGRSEGGEPPPEPPTAQEPLRGLKHLGAVAVVGREAVLALASMAVEYLWQDIAVAGTIVLIAGPPAEGKTTLLFLVLAARMNTGAPVKLLGRTIQPAQPGQYLVLIEGEHSDSSTARKLVKSLRLLKLDDSGLDRVIIVARKAVRLGSPEWMDVGRLVAAGLVSDIALDTIARVAPADANDEREQVALFDEVARTIELAPEGPPKPTAWAVAHTRKNGGNGDLADVSGSAQRTGQADSVLMIKGEKVDGRTVATTVTFAKLREDPDDYPMPVTFSIVAEDGEPTLVLAGPPEDDDRPLETRIVDLLKVRGPMTKNGLRDALKRNSNTIDDAITALFDSRSIKTTTVKVRGKDTKAFELNPKPRSWSDEAP